MNGSREVAAMITVGVHESVLVHIGQNTTWSMEQGPDW